MLADRIKDLTNVGGVRPNQLVGYGIVAGLAGTGDGKDPTFTGQSLKAILESLGVTTNPYDDYDLAQSRGRPLQVDNVAAVMVTATLPPFAKPGQLVDVNVSARHGPAYGWQFGQELRGIDGQTWRSHRVVSLTGVQRNKTAPAYRLASLPGRPRRRHSRAPSDTSFDKSDYIVFNVNTNDFSTTAAITEAVNDTFGEGTAFALDGVSLQ